MSGRCIFSNHGFTIIEVMTITAILAILTTLALPNYKRNYDNYQLKASAQELAQNIQLIQQRAITEGVSWRMVFNDANKASYQIVQGFTSKRTKLPPRGVDTA